MTTRRRVFASLCGAVAAAFGMKAAQSRSVISPTDASVFFDEMDELFPKPKTKKRVRFIRDERGMLCGVHIEEVGCNV